MNREDTERLENEDTGEISDNDGDNQNRILSEFQFKDESWDSSFLNMDAVETSEHTENGESMFEIQSNRDQAFSEVMEDNGVEEEDTNCSLKRRKLLKKAPDAPKRFKSAYICFVMDKMDELRNSMSEQLKVCRSLFLEVSQGLMHLLRR